MKAFPAGRTRQRVTAGLLAVTLLSGCVVRPPDDHHRDTPVVKPVKKTITIGVDALQQGFNPHLAGQATESTTALADLTLPSVFTRVPDRDSDSGDGWQLNTDLMAGAELSNNGRVITYSIRQDAQWSSNPTWQVDVRDFKFMTDMMMEYPGVSSTTGYDLITDISSQDYGKTVIVTLSRPYAGWRGLFWHLLPSFAFSGGDLDELESLNTEIPSSAGSASVVNLDVNRGEISLGPNDKFTGEHRLGVDRIVLRRLDSDEQIPEGLRHGDVRAAYLGANSVVPRLYEGIPGLKLHPVLRPRVLNLDINAASPFLGGEPSLRSAILGAVDVSRVAEITTVKSSTLPQLGHLPWVNIPQSVTVAPSSGIHLAESTQSLYPNGGALTDAWAAAGISVDTVDRQLTRGTLSRPLVIGVVERDRAARVAAGAIADDLNRKGIPTIVYRTSGLTLSGTLLPEGSVDMTVGWSDVSRGVVDAVAARYGCSPSETPRPLRESTIEDRQELPSGDDAEKHTVVANVLQGARAGNISGICDPRLNGLIDTLRDRYETEGSPSQRAARINELLPGIEARVRELHITLPIIQETGLEILGPARSSEPTRVVPESEMSSVQSAFSHLSGWK